MNREILAEIAGFLYGIGMSNKELKLAVDYADRYRF